MLLPPFFSYILFFIIDTLALVCYVSILLSPLGWIINLLGNFLYFTICLVKYGPQKTGERLFNFRKGKKLKKVIKVLGGSFIPYVHIWSIYDDYKQDLEEIQVKKITAQTEAIEIEKAKQAELVKETNLAREQSSSVQESRQGIGKEVTQNKQAEESETSEVESEGDRREEREESRIENPWLISQSRKSKKANPETTLEEVGGIRTGLKREDYEDNLTNFSKVEAYEAYASEKNQERLAKNRQREKENRAKSIQGVKVEQSLRKEMLEKSQKRFGKKTKEAEALEDKYKESLGEERLS